MFGSTLLAPFACATLQTGRNFDGRLVLEVMLSILSVSALGLRDPMRPALCAAAKKATALKLELVLALALMPWQSL
eukprot:symbB.v1.2.024846.t1/scaffold2376.1/size80753/1